LLLRTYVPAISAANWHYFSRLDKSPFPKSRNKRRAELGTPFVCR
jgi:hypothetical protein